jgi:hypothetical protein
MLLIYACLLLVIVLVVESGSLQPGYQAERGQMTQSEIEQVADEGAALYAACDASTVATGTYTAASFGTILASTTPFGNSWGCVKTTGGAYGGDITVVTLLNAPKTVPGITAAGLANTTIQENLADEIVEAMIDRVQFSPNTIVGIIPAGSLALQVLAPANQTITVLSDTLSYATPAIVGNLYVTTPMNNVTSTTP